MKGVVDSPDVSREEGTSGMVTGRKTLIFPSRGWRALDLREIWNYRELLDSRRAGHQGRYKQTALGVAWVILGPS
jgi:lipopolysaccharide transport system permease protein